MKTKLLTCELILMLNYFSLRVERTIRWLYINDCWLKIRWRQLGKYFLGVYIYQTTRELFLSACVLPSCLVDFEIASCAPNEQLTTCSLYRATSQVTRGRAYVLLHIITRLKLSTVTFLKLLALIHVFRDNRRRRARGTRAAFANERSPATVCELPLRFRVPSSVQNAFLL